MPEITLRVQCQGIVNIFLAPEKPRWKPELFMESLNLGRISVSVGAYPIGTNKSGCKKTLLLSHPSWVRGLKRFVQTYQPPFLTSHLARGAWIETPFHDQDVLPTGVAPLHGCVDWNMNDHEDVQEAICRTLHGCVNQKNAHLTSSVRWAFLCSNQSLK